MSILLPSSFVLRRFFVLPTSLLRNVKTQFYADAAYAQELDQQDELAPFRDEFVVDDPDTIYLDGNSLGRLPLRGAARACARPSSRSGASG